MDVAGANQRRYPSTRSSYGRVLVRASEPHSKSDFLTRDSILTRGVDVDKDAAVSGLE
jgi:hypothetical protein